MKPILLRAAVTSVIFALSACSSTPPAGPNLNDAAVVKSLVNVWRDQYVKGGGFIGPELSPVKYKNLYLRALRLEGKPLVYQIFVRDQYRDNWRFYDAAYDSDGNRLNFASIDRKTDDCRYGCDFYETMSITVPLGYLEQRRDRGLIIKIMGKAGERVVEVPAGYVAGFVDAVKSQ